MFGSDATDQVLGKQRISAWLADPDMSKPFCHQSPAGRGGACFTPDKYNVDVYNMGSKNPTSSFPKQP